MTRYIPAVVAANKVTGVAVAVDAVSPLAVFIVAAVTAFTAMLGVPDRPPDVPPTERLVTGVVEVTARGAVPVAIVDTN